MKWLPKLITIIFTLFILLTLNRCKKNSLNDITASNNMDVKQIETTVKSYLEKITKSTTKYRAQKISNLENIIDYKSLVIKNLNDNSKIILGDLLISSNSKTAGNYIKKVVFYLTDKTITSGNIVGFNSNEALPSDLDDIITLKHNNFTGAMMMRTLYDNYVIQFDFKNGNVADTKTLDKRPSKNNSGRTNSYCVLIDWYLTTRITIGGVVYSSEEYVGSTCDGGGDCTMEDPTVMTLECNSDNGGGSNETQTCNNIDVEEVSDIVSIDLSDESGSSRTKNYVWKALTSPGNLWHVNSHETGTCIQGSDNLWRWQSIIHDGTSIEGTVVGGTLDVTLNSATPTVGEFWAGMAINVNVKASITCPGLSVPITTYKDYNPVHYFNVND